jgi:Spy/CpxP family protein refolding chaperone
LAEWSTANQAQVTAAKSAVADAKKAGDKDALAKAQTALKQLEAGRTKIEQDAEKAMQDILTPAQRATAECCQMDSGFLHEFGKLTLTAEQQAKIKDICLGDSKSFEGLKPDDKDGRKALHAAA